MKAIFLNIALSGQPDFVSFSKIYCANYTACHINDILKI